MYRLTTLAALLMLPGGLLAAGPPTPPRDVKDAIGHAGSAWAVLGLVRTSPGTSRAAPP